MLLPVVMATLFIGDVVANLATMGDPKEPRSALLWVLTIGAMLWSLLGQLSVISMVLRPGQTVADSIKHGASRLPKLMLVVILLVAVVLVATVPLGLVLIRAGVNPDVPQTMQNVPGWVPFVLLGMLGLLFWIGVRFALLNAMIVDQNPGFGVLFKRAFALTKGISAQLAVVMIIYAVTMIVLLSAVRFIFGTVFTLLGEGIGSPFVGLVLTTLSTSFAGSMLSAVAIIYLAILYRYRTANTQT